MDIYIILSLDNPRLPNADQHLIIQPETANGQSLNTFNNVIYIGCVIQHRAIPCS